MELAQLVCERSNELCGTYGPDDVGDAALNLVRTVGSDKAVFQHASAIFQTRLDADPADATSRDGLRLLTRAMAFLR